jgi:hypothetical protein
MTRLPIPGSDDNSWGSILNDFLHVEHNDDGTLKASASLAAKANNADVVHNSGAEVVCGTKTFSSSPVVPAPTLGSHTATKTYVDIAVAAGTPDATSSTKGLVQLSGDLSGTATAPTVPGLSGKQPLSSGLTAIASVSAANDDILQYKSGAWANRTPAQLKTDLLLVKADVGLANTDNTSDATKNSAAVTLTNKTLSAPVIQSPVVQGSAVISLTDAATITTNVALGNVFWVVLGGNRTMAAPTNPVNGQKIIFRIKQDATGSRTVTWNAVFRFGADVLSPTLTATANKTDYIGFIYNGTDSTWDCLAVTHGY